MPVLAMPGLLRHSSLARTDVRVFLALENEWSGKKHDLSTLLQFKLLACHNGVSNVSSRPMQRHDSDRLWLLQR
jgi:hypothetical protein